MRRKVSPSLIDADDCPLAVEARAMLDAVLRRNPVAMVLQYETPEAFGIEAMPNSIAVMVGFAAVFNATPEGDA